MSTKTYPQTLYFLYTSQRKWMVGFIPRLHVETLTIVSCSPSAWKAFSNTVVAPSNFKRPWERFLARYTSSWLGGHSDRGSGLSKQMEMSPVDGKSLKGGLSERGLFDYYVIIIRLTSCSCVVTGSGWCLKQPSCSALNRSNVQPQTQRYNHIIMPTERYYFILRPS